VRRHDPRFIGCVIPIATPTTRRDRPAELFDAWLVAEMEATLALSAWKLASRRCKRGAYAAYVAALNREGLAADMLAAGLRAT
jgi:hypothetical protein